MKSLPAWIVQHRLALFIFSIAVILLAGYGGSKITFKSDYTIFFEKDNPQRIANEFIQEEFSSSDNVLFLVNPKNGDIFTRENLAAIESLTEDAWQIPYSQRVDSLTNFQHTFVDGDDLLVEDLFQNSAEMSEADIQERKRIALEEPLLIHRLISPEGHVSAINVQINFSQVEQTFATPEVVEAVRTMRAEFEAQNPNLELLITGIVPLNNAFNEMSIKDSETLVPLMLLVILVLLGVMLRSPSSIVITLMVIIASVVSAVCLQGWIEIPINSINSAAPIVILTLSVADCVHILSHYLTGLRKGLSKQDAMVKSLDVNLMPVFLTSLTTAIGFLSMLSSDSPPFRELGLICAIGVMFAFLFSLTILPQLVMWITRTAPSIDTQQTSLYSHVADFTLRYPKPLFFGSLIFAGICMAFIGQNELNDDNFGYFSKKIEVRKAADFAEENLNGVNILEYAIDSKEQNGVNDPAFLAKVDEFANWYRQQDKVTHVFTFTDIMKRLNKNMNNDDPAYYRLPENRELASQYQVLYEMSLPFGMDLNNQINLNKSAVRITVSIKGAKAKEILAMEAKAQQWFQENAPELATDGASPSMMFAAMGQRNINSMLDGTVIATVLISFILVLTLGSWKLGILSLIPNAFPAAIMLGIWGMFVAEVNLAVAVVFGVTLGIVVDDTVHFLSKYLRGYKLSNGNTEKAIHYAFEHVGAALVTTTIVLALGFGMLALSDFNVNGILGIMVSMTILIALVFDFLFLPSMLMMLRSFIHPNSTAPIENDNSGSENANPSPLRGEAA